MRPQRNGGPQRRIACRAQRLGLALRDREPRAQALPFAPQWQSTDFLGFGDRPRRHGAVGGHDGCDQPLTFSFNVCELEGEEGVEILVR